MNFQWDQVRDLRLSVGVHDTRERGMCAMEAVAWLAGEPHSDHPQCTCLVLGAFIRSLNDSLGDEDRDRLLKPLLRNLINTKSSAYVAMKRAYLALDWFIRVNAPEWIALCADLEFHSHMLRRLPVIVNTDTAIEASVKVLDAARSAAHAAAHAPDGHAVRGAGIFAAVGRAIGESAASAAWTAGGEAAAASESAGDSARAAAGDAALTAVARAISSGMITPHDIGDFLCPTKNKLQSSALELFDRMLAVKDEVQL